MVEFIASGWCYLYHQSNCPRGVDVPCVVRDGTMLCVPCDTRKNPPGASGVCPDAGSP